MIFKKYRFIFKKQGTYYTFKFFGQYNNEKKKKLKIFEVYVDGKQITFFNM